LAQSHWSGSPDGQAGVFSEIERRQLEIDESASGAARGALISAPERVDQKKGFPMLGGSFCRICSPIPLVLEHQASNLRYAMLHSVATCRNPS
jgi:hypothetical protein